MFHLISNFQGKQKDLFSCGAAVMADMCVATCFFLLLSPHSHNTPPSMPPLFFSSKSDVLLKMQRTGTRAWQYVIAFLVLRIAQATLATSQVQSPYLLGLGE